MVKKSESSIREKPTKFEYTFEDEDCISIWKYDKTKFPNGPISVENKWKPAFTNRIKLIQKETKEAKKVKTKTNEKNLNKFK